MLTDYSPFLAAMHLQMYHTQPGESSGETSGDITTQSYSQLAYCQIAPNTIITLTLLHTPIMLLS